MSLHVCAGRLLPSLATLPDLTITCTKQPKFKMGQRYFTWQLPLTEVFRGSYLAKRHNGNSA